MHLYCASQDLVYPLPESSNFLLLNKAGIEKLDVNATIESWPFKTFFFSTVCFKAANVLIKKHFGKFKIYQLKLYNFFCRYLI